MSPDSHTYGSSPSMAGEIADADNIMTVDDEDDERNYVCF